MAVPAPGRAFARVRQGDLVRVPEFSYISHDEGALTAKVAATTLGLFAIVTGDCDVERETTEEPNLLVAMIVPARDQQHWQTMRRGMSFRYFAYPKLDACDYPLLDVRYCQSIEKEALAATSTEIAASPLSAPERVRLREWLARRTGRTPFPGEAEDMVLRHLRDVVEDRLGKPNPAGGLADSREAVLVSLPDQTRGLEVVFLIDKLRAASHLQLRADPARLLTQAAQTIMATVDQRAKGSGSTYVLSHRWVYSQEMAVADYLHKYADLR